MKLAWDRSKPASLAFHIAPYTLTVVIIVVMVAMHPVVICGPTVVVSPVIRIPAVITVWIIPWIAVIAVPVGRVSESNAYSSNSD